MTDEELRARVKASRERLDDVVTSLRQIADDADPSYGGAQAQASNGLIFVVLPVVAAAQKKLLLLEKGIA